MCAWMPLVVILNPPELTLQCAVLLLVPSPLQLMLAFSCAFAIPHDLMVCSSWLPACLQGNFGVYSRWHPSASKLLLAHLGAACLQGPVIVYASESLLLLLTGLSLPAGQY